MAEHIRCASGESSLGEFIAGMSDRGLVAFAFTDSVVPPIDALHERFPDATIEEETSSCTKSAA